MRGPLIVLQFIESRAMSISCNEFSKHFIICEVPLHVWQSYGFFYCSSKSFSKIVMVHQIDMYTLLKYRCCSFSH